MGWDSGRKCRWDETKESGMLNGMGYEEGARRRDDMEWKGMLSRLGYEEENAEGTK